MRVLVCDGLEKIGVDILRGMEGLVVDDRPDIGRDELKSIIGEYHGLIVRSKTKVTAETIEQGHLLKLIGRAGTGVDNIDVAAATRRGIVVMNAAEGNTVTTAEHTFAMLMALARQIPQATASLKSGKWEKKAFLGVELMGKTLGIVGLGRIGRTVAERAVGFRMNVVGFDPYFTSEAASKLGIQMASFDDLLARADFLTIHTSLTDETRGIIGSAAFAKMKTGVRVINCARGGLIDERALAEAIGSGKVAGAALDVFEEEPLPASSSLLGLDQVIVTPHLGASTEEAQVSVATLMAEQVVDYLSQGTIRGAVNTPAMSAEALAKIGPYMDLGEKLGLFQGQVFGHDLREVNIEYSGEVSDNDVSTISQAILSGLLSPVIERVNVINARVVAEERGIKVTESASRRARDFASLISVRAVTKKSESEVAGALLDRRDPRIVRVNGFNVEAIPKGHMLIVFNRDVPGTLGRIATYLGEQGINIGRLYLGRKKVGETALALVQTDQALSAGKIADLASIQDVLSAQQLKL
jgi:D-3-phosphoglycerate dehydrogenase